MDRAPAIIVIVAICLAALALGPFGQASGSEVVAASYAENGVQLHGTVERHDASATHDVSCGDALIVGATDVITSDTDFSGTVEHQGRTLQATTDEVQFVQQDGVVVCIDAEGSLLDDEDTPVAHWHLRPNADGVPELRIRR